VQSALAQTAIDEAAGTVARDTLQSRAQLHNLKIVEKGGDGHCPQYLYRINSDDRELTVKP